MNIRALIADDEPHAREGIRLRLEQYNEISILGECSSGLQAVEMINHLSPDLLFLDIQMPGMNGFEVLQNITIQPLPVIIFVTAYDKYALKAFEFHALDYLLKPINEVKFNDTVNTALVEVKHRHLDSYAGKILALISHYEILNESEKKEYLTRLTIKAKENISIIPVGDIDWLESAGDYIYVHTKIKKHIFRETLTALENRLNPQVFVRIHRSVIVNIEKVQSLRTNEHGDYDVFLKDGIKLKLSRNYRAHFQQVIGNSL
jgi:two-component system, LytTR family, response regulator